MMGRCNLGDIIEEGRIILKFIVNRTMVLKLLINHLELLVACWTTY
jgi:hypothetical protein